MSDSVFTAGLEKRLAARAAAAAILALLLSALPSQGRSLSLEANGEGLFLRSRDGRTDLELDGRIFLDFTTFEGAFNNEEQGRSASDDELRSTMLRIRGRLHKNLRIFVQYETERRHLVVGSMTWRVARPGLDVTFGLLKEPFGFEFQSTRRHLATMERPLVQTLMPGITLGVRLRHQGERFSYAGGVFADRDERHRTGATGRFIWWPVKSDEKVLHFAVSASQRNQDGALRETTRGPVRAASTIGQSALASEIPLADTTTHFGFEAVGLSGPLTWQFEAVAERVDAVVPENDATYAGYYGQGTYFLRGARRTYQDTQGRFGPTAPKRKRDALELVGRVEAIDLDSGALPGTRVGSLLLGINWHRSRNLTLMVQAVRSRVSGRAAPEVLGPGTPSVGYAVAMRFMIMI